MIDTVNNVNGFQNKRKIQVSTNAEFESSALAVRATSNDIMVYVVHCDKLTLNELWCTSAGC